MNKTGPNEMRVLLARMRNGKNINPNALTEVKKNNNPSMRDLLKITRNLSEAVEDGTEAQEPRINKKNVYDQTREVDRMRQFFKDLNVNIEFIELQVYDDLIFFGGTIDGVIQFIYTVTPDEKTSGVEFNYLTDFDRNSTDNQMIIDLVESYYDSFYRYWRDVLDAE